MNSVHRTALATPILLSLQFANFIRTQELFDGESLRTKEPDISESPEKSSTAHRHQLITIIILATFQFLSLVVILVLVAITCRLYLAKRRLAPQNQIKDRVNSNQYKAPLDETQERPVESLHIYANIESVPVRPAGESKGVSSTYLANKSHLSDGSFQCPTFHSPLNYEKTTTLKSLKSIMDSEQVQELEEPNNYTVMHSPNKCT